MKGLDVHISNQHTEPSVGEPTRACQVLFGVPYLKDKNGSTKY